MLPSRAELRAHLGLIKSGEQPTSWWVVRANYVFRAYFCGSVISDLGTWLQNTAQVLLAYHLSHSVLAVAVVTCAQFSSPLVLGPFAGVLTDRIGGRKTLLATQVVACAVAAALAGLEFAGHLGEWMLAGGALLSGLCFTFALPARNVTVRRLVPPNQVRAAFALDSVSYNLGRAIAPLMSVGLVFLAGYGWAFLGNAVSFAVFTVILWKVGQGGSAEPERRSRITDGFRIASGEGRIIILLLMVAAVTIADDPVLVLGPAIAHRMGYSPSWSGWFIAALGAGTVLGSLRRSRHLPSLRLAATALALLGGCMVTFVMTPWIEMSIIAAIGAGVSCLVANAATRTLLSRAAGPDRQAAVMAIWAIAWAGSKPFASLMDGLLAGWVGIWWTGVILAIPAFIPIAVMLVAPSLGRRLVNHQRKPRIAVKPVPSSFRGPEIPDDSATLPSPGMRVESVVPEESEALKEAKVPALSGMLMPLEPVPVPERHRELPRTPEPGPGARPFPAPETAAAPDRLPATAGSR
ncbi:MAG TPA: MFS transporter [Trebonia sp.]|nr:MFS transporter [Trebonia sp.]